MSQQNPFEQEDQQSRVSVFNNTKTDFDHGKRQLQEIDLAEFSAELKTEKQDSENANEGDGKINEKFLLFKIDLCVLSYVCLQYWINYVDRVGFSNAYVSGMKETLNLKGNDFNVINTCFSVGYIISMIPHNLILLRVPPKIWLSFCTLSWGLLTLGLHAVSDFKQCCAIRFFQGIFESCTFSGTHLILGSWYKEEELPFRSAIFTSSGLVGSLFSGFMQTGIYKSLNGKAGLEGWRWLFLIDFFITLPISIMSLVYFPDPPAPTSLSNKDENNSKNDTKPKSFIQRGFTLIDKLSIVKKIFKPEELRYAKKRLPIRDETKTSLDWSVFKRVLGRWHWWLFSLVWALGGLNISFSSNSTFSLYLLDLNYSITQRNNYPMGIYAVAIVATLVSCSYLSIFKNRHLDISIFISVVMIIVAVMILSDPLKPAVMFTAQYIGGICYAGQAIFFSWANVVCANDLQERAIVLASMNMFSGAINAWWSIVFYSATTAPKFKKGCYAMFATAISTAIVSIMIRVLQKREDAKRNIINYVNLNDEAVPESFEKGQ